MASLDIIAATGRVVSTLTGGSPAALALELKNALIAGGWTDMGTLMSDGSYKLLSQQSPWNVPLTLPPDDYVAQCMLYVNYSGGFLTVRAANAAETAVQLASTPVRLLGDQSYIALVTSYSILMYVPGLFGLSQQIALAAGVPFLPAFQQVRQMANSPEVQDAIYCADVSTYRSGLYTPIGPQFCLYQSAQSTVVNTTIGSAISAGAKTLSRTTTSNIYVGETLAIGGANPETVVVTAITDTTYTATFANSHLAADPVTGNAPAFWTSDHGSDYLSSFSILGLDNPTDLAYDTTSLTQSNFTAPAKWAPLFVPLRVMWGTGANSVPTLKGFLFDAVFCSQVFPGDSTIMVDASPNTLTMNVVTDNGIAQNGPRTLAGTILICSAGGTYPLLT